MEAAELEAALGAPDRRRRRDALVALAASFEAPLDDEERARARFVALHEPVLAALDDDAETCREAAIAALRALVAATPPSDVVLAYAFPKLVARLACEPAEELRLALARAALELIGRYGGGPYLAPFYDDAVECCASALADRFAEVKKVGCEAVVALAAALPREFHLRAEKLVAAAAPALRHRHSKVRVAAVRAIGAAVSNGGAACFESCLYEFANAFLDDSPDVRSHATKQLGNWMLEYEHRYSTFQFTIPFMLSSLCDPYEHISAEAKTLWEKVGAQYVNENEEDFKPSLDFLSEPPKHYPPVARPNLGCRTLVTKYMYKIIQQINKELEVGQSEIKLRSAQIMYWIILNAESKNTQYFVDIVNCLRRGAEDDDPNIVAEVQKASELVGYFIDPSVWWNYMLPDLDHSAYLFILTHIIKGSDVDVLKNKYLKKILKELSLTRLLTKSDSAKYQMNLLNVCESLLSVCTVYLRDYGQNMFNILFIIFATPRSEDVEKYAFSLIEKLHETLQIGSNLDDMYCIFIRQILVNISTEPCYWTLASPDKCILNAILKYSGSSIGLNLHLLAPILVEALTAGGMCPDVKLEVFNYLSMMLLGRDERLKLTEIENLNAFMDVILQSIIIPNLKWSVGRTAEAMRTAAVCCLCAILQENEDTVRCENDINFSKCATSIDLFLDKESLQNLIETLLPLLISLLKDNSKLTRQYTLKAICCLVQRAKKKDCINVDHIHKTYSDVLARLDDSNDMVRRCAVETLCILFTSLPKPYDVNTFDVHIDSLYTAMLRYLDDPDTVFQENILDALKRVCVVHPTMLKGKVDSSTNLFRNQKALEHLDKHLESLSI